MEYSLLFHTHILYSRDLTEYKNHDYEREEKQKQKKGSEREREFRHFRDYNDQYRMRNIYVWVLKCTRTILYKVYTHIHICMSTDTDIAQLHLYTYKLNFVFSHAVCCSSVLSFLSDMGV